MLSKFVSVVSWIGVVDGTHRRDRRAMLHRHDHQPSIRKLHRQRQRHDR